MVVVVVVETSSDSSGAVEVVVGLSVRGGVYQWYRSRRVHCGPRDKSGVGETMAVGITGRYKL